MSKDKCGAVNPLSCRHHGIGKRIVVMGQERTEAVSAGDFNKAFTLDAQITELKARQEQSKAMTATMEQAQAEGNYEKYAAARQELYALAEVEFSPGAETAAEQQSPFAPGNYEVKNLDGRIIQAKEGKTWLNERLNNQGPKLIHVAFENDLTQEQRGLAEAQLRYAYAKVTHSKSFIFTGSLETENNGVLLEIEEPKDRFYDGYVEDLQDEITNILKKGSPIRKTDRAGMGTQGTRAVEGQPSSLGKMIIRYA